MSAGSSSFSLPAQRFRRQVGIQLEVRDLCQRMDAGVGSSRSIELELAAPGDLADRAIDFPLHRPRILLDLPAAVARAGILDQQFESRHGVMDTDTFADSVNW